MKNRGIIPHKLKIVTLLTALSLIDYGIEAGPNGKITTIPQGRIKGRYSETRGGRTFVEYLGIPYAQPPRRFKGARWPPPKWDWIRDCTKRPQPCFQMKGQVAIGDEDCLTLNVATPATYQNYWVVQNKPVFVVFHGGAWMVDRMDWTGGESDQLGPKHFMDEDCVIVTVNYRLGVFGFFTLFSSEGPANLGLKDQVLALRWVKEYIKFFGGNPDLVTIVGQGAGAASVGLHLLSPLSKGLYHRAIMQSGSPLCHWALVVGKEQAGYPGLEAFKENTGCTGTGTDVLACLETKKPDELEQARIKILESPFFDPFFPFGPVVEHWVREDPRRKVFLPDYPLNILNNATNDTWGGIPILMGVNSQDGLTFMTGQYIYNPGLKDKYFSNYTESYPSNFGFGPSTGRVHEDSLNEISDKIREFYYGSIPVEEMSNKAHHQIHIDMYSHRNYFQCVKNAAVLYAKWSDVYLYYWSRVSTSFKKWHDYDKLNLTKGQAHGDEIHFLFDTADDYGDFMLIRNSRPKHLKFSQNVVKLWMAFAGRGKPIDTWPSMKGRSKSNLEWYQLGDERMPIKEPFTKYTDFWDNLWDEKSDLPPPGNHTRKKLGKNEKAPDINAFIYVDFDEEKKKK